MKVEKNNKIVKNNEKQNVRHQAITKFSKNEMKVEKITRY